MKILYVITKSNFGGAQKYVLDLAVAEKDRGHDVAVALGGEGILKDKLAAAGVRAISISSLERDVSVSKDAVSLMRIYSIIKSEHPDVLHLNSSKAGGLGALAGRLLGTRHIVFTAHGWPFAEKRNPLWRSFAFLGSWATVLLSHAIICVSDRDLALARQMPFIGNKAMRIYNGIKPIDFLPRANGDERVQVLTNAELNPNKNLFVAVDAVISARSHGANIRYDIASDGELRAELERYIREKNASDFIKLLGYVPDAARTYARYDIFFLPSRKEGLPYVLLEAGLAKLAVVASDVGGIPEIILDGVSGILRKSEDVSGFAEALVELAKDAALRERLGSALERHVRETFSFEKMVTNTETCYNARQI